MRIRLRTGIAGAAALVVAAGVLVAGATAASAAVTPGWEPNARAAGGVTLYDASGAVITSGSLDARPFAAYAAATGAGVGTDTKAVAYLYTPVQGQDPLNWNGDQLGSATTFPNTAAPAPVKNLTVPVVTGSADDLTLNEAISDFPNSSTVAGYQNLYEVRLRTSPQGAGAPTYYRVDIEVNQTTGTWSVVYPVGPVATTTTLAASPNSPVDANTAVTLTAKVAPTAAGSVQFKEGATVLGTATVDGSGNATYTFTPASGTHSYTAVFTPSDATAYQSSTSAALPFVVNAAAADTTTTLTASPDSGSAGDDAGNLAVTLTAKVAPTGLDGSLHFFDGDTDLGVADSYTASTGTGTKVVSLNGNASPHYLTATFTPTSGSYQKSTSAVLTYVVTLKNYGSAQITVQATNNTPPYAGDLSLQVGSSTTVNLTQISPSSTDPDGHPVVASDTTGHRHAWVFTGTLGGVSVQDTRPTEPGWTVTGQATTFVNGAISVPAANLGWTPKYVSTGSDVEGAVSVGAAIKSLLALVGSKGLSEPAKLASVAAGSGLGTANLSSDLELRIPDTSATGTYSSTLTLTLISP